MHFLPETEFTRELITKIAILSSNLDASGLVSVVDRVGIFQIFFQSCPVFRKISATLLVY